MNWYDFLLRNRGEVMERTGEHIGLVASAMAIALIIGLPLGVALVRRRTLQRWVLGVANVVQTIPSLALFGFLIPVPQSVPLHQERWLGLVMWDGKQWVEPSQRPASQELLWGSA